MAIDTDIQTFTDAELLKLYRKALADIAVGGQGYGLSGRTLTRADLGDIIDVIEKLEGRIEEESNTEGGGSVVLAQFGDPA
jgi:hypothetical protein